MKNPTDLIFKTEHLFTLYLQRIGQSREKLPVEQLQEIRRAYYGALGQLFCLLTQDIYDLKSREQGKVLASIQNQIGDFWENELKKHEQGILDVHPSRFVKCDGCGWSGKIEDLQKPAEGSGMAVCPKCKNEKLLF